MLALWVSKLAAPRFRCIFGEMLAWYFSRQNLLRIQEKNMQRLFCARLPCERVLLPVWRSLLRGRVGATLVQTRAWFFRRMVYAAPRRRCRETARTFRLDSLPLSLPRLREATRLRRGGASRARRSAGKQAEDMQGFGAARGKTR